MTEELDNGVKLVARSATSISASWSYMIARFCGNRKETVGTATPPKQSEGELELHSQEEHRGEHHMRSLRRP